MPRQANRKQTLVLHLKLAAEPEPEVLATALNDPEPALDDPDSVSTSRFPNVFPFTARGNGENETAAVQLLAFLEVL